MKKKIEDYIKEILIQNYSDQWEIVYDNSELIKYLNLKSGAIHGNSTTRRALANWYSIYAILTFYKNENFIGKKDHYLNFQGFPYSSLLEFIRNQYGGSKLQNHALNSRVNGEFKNKLNSDTNLIIINNGKYLIHPRFLYITVNNKEVDITPTVLEIIKAYQTTLLEKDNNFATSLKNIESLDNYKDQIKALLELLNEDTEARVFEIMAYAILESHYKNTKIYIGYYEDKIKEKYLELYKTGRTNANDGGIDFVMRPLGRFFQVTEVDKYEKYFLDIDKINHYPITFVVKTKRDAQDIYKELIDYGHSKSGGLEVLNEKYEAAIEEVITINELTQWITGLDDDSIKFLINEIDRYFKMEMNIVELD